MAWVVVWGPKGCGKTANAERLRQALGMRRVVDDFTFGDGRRCRSGDLALTSERPPSWCRRAVPFDRAMKMVEARGL